MPCAVHKTGKTKKITEIIFPLLETAGNYVSGINAFNILSLNILSRAKNKKTIHVPDTKLLPDGEIVDEMLNGNESVVEYFCFDKFTPMFRYIFHKVVDN